MQNLDVKKMSKAGVSLVAVLLFMLIATIAATATWKWLTSEGRSSESRMLQREAYQSAQAGLENARAWMTFHGNDVGALVKQFVEDPNHLPINIDNRLREIQRAGQNYHVWLTGVNTEKSTYKLKFLSSGESRRNTRHNEVAVFNVDGLYHVVVPKSEEILDVDFRFNYFGGSTKAQGATGATSLLINGNLDGSNPVYTQQDLIVTGAVNMTGSSIGVDGTACVGGNFDGNNGVYGNNFYIGGNASHFTWPTSPEGKSFFENPNAGSVSSPALSLVGDVYIEGNLDNGPQNQIFPKNLTLNGVWNTNYSAYQASVTGNLCMGENGQIHFPTLPTVGRKFTVGGHVYVQNSQMFRVNMDEFKSLAVSGSTSKNYDNIQLGVNSDAKVYVYGAKSYKYYTESSPAYRNSESNRGRRKGSCHGYGGYWYDCYEDYQPYQSGRALKNNEGYLNYWSDQYFIDLNPISVEFGKDKNDPSSEYSNYFINDLLVHADYVDDGAIVSYYRETSSHGCNSEMGYTKGPEDEETEHKIYFPKCYVYPWFKSNGDVSANVPSEQPETIQCAESIKNYCMAKLGTEVNGTGCDGADYKVNDMLVTAYTQFLPYANLGCNITSWDHDLSARLNACYTSNLNHKNNLYNGYQVVRLESTELKNSKTPLKGKFIIIVTNEMGQQNLPPTEENSFVFLYLEKGSKGSIQPSCSSIEGACTSTKYNYFIYTTADMSSVLFNNDTFSGSIYAEAKSCSKVSSFMTRKLELNEDLLRDLATAHIICNASVGASCGDPTAESSSSSSSDVDVVNLMDRYFITMAPQLSVTLESQSKSDIIKEKLPPIKRNGKTNDLDSSYIVLPRVLSLPDDPYGSFYDYLNVLPLNGSHLTKEKLSLKSCSPLPGTSGALSATFTSKLYTPGTSKLNHGSYKCIIKAEDYDQEMPFWVVVGESSRSVPMVRFTTTSQVIARTSSAGVTVDVFVPAHDQLINLNVHCPAEPNENWEYVRTPLEDDPTTCVIPIPAKPEKDTTITLFEVTTNDATMGSMQFQLLAGEGYNVGIPSSTVILLASTVCLNREEAPIDAIKAFCEETENADVCPSTTEEIENWPNCDIDDPWVQPAGTGFMYVENYKNENWSIFVQGAGSLYLDSIPNGQCVVIVPKASLGILALEPGHCYSLKASAKQKNNKLKLVYKGDVGADKTPEFKINITNHAPITCRYGGANTTCWVTAYSGEQISLKIDKDNPENENFSYWRCAGASCPTTYAISSDEYEPFKLKDNETVIYVHFGETDKHCFFDEFKKESVECNPESINKYCISTCGAVPGHCASAESEEGDNVKWRLLKGSFEDLKYDSRNGKLSVKKNEDVTVMSTVRAGLTGKLKALVQVPRVPSSNGAEKANVRNTGFILRSNATATNYLMLNVFANQSNEATAQLCAVSLGVSSDCQYAVLTHESGTLRVDESSMLMVEAEFNKSDELIVKVFKGESGNYYGEYKEYTKTFDLTEYSNVADYANDYVGYRLANANFSLLGIGWLSTDYGYTDECFDTYPTVKCSFAARAVNGIIPLDTLVEPWVGHSGWYDSHEFGCNKKFYYYNGDDACGGTSSWVPCSNGYTFSESGAGEHGGYDGSGNPVKTAKAGMQCWLNDLKDQMWTANPEDESYRAHCGSFWTGKFTECTEHKELMPNQEITLYSTGAEQTVVFDTPINMRADTLVIDAENSASNEIEVWLLSKDDNDWYGGDLHPSLTVTMRGSQAKFDVVKDLAGNGGFNPEKVVQIAFMNKGGSSATIKSAHVVCPNAFGVASCDARLEGNSWKIKANITNIENVAEYKVTGVRHDKGPAHDHEESFSVTSDWVQASDVSRYPDEDAVMFTYTTEGPLPKGEYSFTVIAKSDASIEDSRACSVTGKVEDVSCVTQLKGNSSVTYGEASPQIYFNLTKCPPDGCGSYEIRLDGSAIENGTGTCTGPGPGHEKCEVQKSGPAQPSVGDHVYTVVSTSNPTRFTCESQTFTVEEESSSSSAESSSSEIGLIVECGPIANQTDKEPGTTIEVTPSMVSGCGNSDCSYTVAATGHTISPATSTTYNGGKVSFTDNDASGTVAYTLTISHGTASETCSFSVTYLAPSSSSEAESSSSNEESSSSEASSSSEESSSSATSPCIPFVNGVYGYNEHCYNSGLKNMAAGKCYTMNPDRVPGGVPQWINDEANQTWWWVETPCDGSGL